MPLDQFYSFHFYSFYICWPRNRILYFNPYCIIYIVLNSIRFRIVLKMVLTEYSKPHKYLKSFIMNLSSIWKEGARMNNPIPSFNASIFRPIVKIWETLTYFFLLRPSLIIRKPDLVIMLRLNVYRHIKSLVVQAF